jgi:hypothetical protein
VYLWPTGKWKREISLKAPREIWINKNVMVSFSLVWNADDQILQRKYYQRKCPLKAC